MGWISKRHMQSGGSLNRNPKNNGSDKGPLRKILGLVADPKLKGVMVELLECGHTQLPRTDIIGITHPERRRCRKCKRAQSTGEN